jgi:hypothetical protein
MRTLPPALVIAVGGVVVISPYLAYAGDQPQDLPGHLWC